MKVRGARAHKIGLPRRQRHRCMPPSKHLGVDRVSRCCYVPHEQCVPRTARAAASRLHPFSGVPAVMPPPPRGVAAAFAACLVMLAACNDNPTATPAATASSEATVAASASLPEQVPDHARAGETVFRDLARQVPEFGGFYISQQSDVVVQLTDLRRIPAMRAAIMAHLKERTGEDGSHDLTRQRIVFRAAEYSFDQLTGWRARIEEPLFDLPEVLMLDLDEELNRVTVGVDAAASQYRALAVVERAGVPRGAVNIRVIGALVPASTLLDVHRPLQGGLTIASSAGGCTLGFNAVLGGRNVFLTNSHCSARSWDLDYGSFYQPFVTSTYQVGYEYQDPNGSSCGFLSKNVCRYADVAAISVNTGTATDLGYIARTTFSASGRGGVGSREIDPINPRFQINSTDVYPELYEQVHKIGAATGWTTGIVTRTCVDTSVSYRSNSRLRCQYLANYGSADGDSGSPVFKMSGSTTVTLQGIHWARVTVDGDAVFSPWGGVQRDLGFMQVTP